jgi:Rrf2 family protein
MILSKSCNYALRASLYIASHDDSNFIPISRISDDLNISFHFLTKILQTLSDAGIMNSLKGPNGGVKLANSPQDISLFGIITAVDGYDVFDKCLLGLDDCHDSKPCPLHDQWAGVRNNLKQIFQSNTLESLSKRIVTENLRLSDLII